MKRILAVIAILVICSTAMAQSHLFDTITFFRGGRLYKLKLYPDRYVINDTTYFAFPGYGVTHNTVPHGDSLFFSRKDGNIFPKNQTDSLYMNYITNNNASSDYDDQIHIISRATSDNDPTKNYAQLYLTGNVMAFGLEERELNVGDVLFGATGGVGSFFAQDRTFGNYGNSVRMNISAYYPNAFQFLFNNNEKYRLDSTAFYPCPPSAHPWINIVNLGTTTSPFNMIYANGGNSSQWNEAHSWGNWASGSLYPKRADSNAWTPYGYATPKSVYDGLVEWSHNFINVNDSTAKWGYAPWWGTNQALLGKEPIISKSTGFLKWTGSAWSWDNSTYVTGTPWTSMGYVTGTPWTGLYWAYSDTSANKKLAAYYTTMAAISARSLPADTGAPKKFAAYSWAVSQLAGKQPVGAYITGLSAGTYTITATYANTAGTANGLASGSYTVTVSNANSAGTCTGNAATVTNGVYKTDIDIIAWIGIDTTNITITGTYFVKYSQGYIIDSIIYSVVRNAGSPDVTVKLWYGSNINSSGTALVTAGNQITSYAGQTRTGTINNASIAAGNVIWATFSAVAVKPKSIFITLKGHKI